MKPNEKELARLLCIFHPSLWPLPPAPKMLISKLSFWGEAISSLEPKCDPPWTEVIILDSFKSPVPGSILSPTLVVVAVLILFRF